jgi:hypothetical protein
MREINITKTYYILACLLLFSGAVMAETVTGAVVALSNFSISPSVVKPGAVGSVSVTFTNNGDGTASALSVYYGELEGTAGIGPKNAGDLAKGTSTTILIPFKVPDSYDTGVYSLPLMVFYSSTKSGNFVIPVTVSKLPVIQIMTQNVSKQLVKPGDEFEVSIRISNMGGEVKDITLSVPQNSTFQFSGISKYVITSLQSNSSANLSLRMISGSGVSTGAYSIPLTVTYTDRLGNTTSESTGVGPVNVVDLATLFSVTAEPVGEAEVGSILNLNVTLSNHGTEDEIGVSVEPLSSSYIIPIGSTSVFLDRIPAYGESSKVVRLGIDPSATAGYYSIPLRIRLGTGQSFNTSIGVLVQAASQLSVSSETSPAMLTPGATADLTVKLSNIGDSGIRSVIVTLSSDSVAITSGQETFIGTLNVDDTGSVIAKVRASQSAKTEDNAIVVTVSFKDSSNQEHKVEKTVYLSTSSSAFASSTSTSSNGTYQIRTNGRDQGLIGLLPIGIGAVVLAVALFFGYKWWTGKGKVKVSRK